jgi:uncharacterized Zn-finger protein
MAITGIVAAKVLERYGPKDAAELAPAAARAATSCAGPGAEALADARSELARFLAAADTIERGQARPRPQGRRAGCARAVLAAAPAAAAAPARLLLRGALAQRPRWRPSPPPAGPSCLSGAIQKLSSYTSFAPMIVIGAVPDVRWGQRPGGRNALWDDGQGSRLQARAAAAAAAARECRVLTQPWPPRPRPPPRIGALVAACVAVANLLGSGLLKAAGLYKVRPRPRRPAACASGRPPGPSQGSAATASWTSAPHAPSPPVPPPPPHTTHQPHPSTPPTPTSCAPQVWPKVFDIVNVSIYCTMAAVAFTHPQWTRLWLPLFTAGLTGSYFLASLLIRRPFCEELAKESAPREVSAPGPLPRARSAHGRAAMADCSRGRRQAPAAAPPGPRAPPRGDPHAPPPPLAPPHKSSGATLRSSASTFGSAYGGRARCGW